MKTSLLYGIVPDASSKTRLRCVFCGVFIPKATKCIEQHTNGSKHKENIDLMGDNGISFTDETLYCKLCKCNLPDSESVSKHVENDDHATWMAAVDDLIDGEFISLESYLASEKEDAHCEVCNISFNCALQTIQEHVNGYTHRSNIVDRLKPLNGIFPVDNDYEVWCKVCDMYVDNTVQGVLNHIDDDETHMEWFTEIEDLIEEQEVSIKEYLSNEHENNAYCKKCHVGFACNVSEIDNHITSEAHLNKFSS